MILESTVPRQQERRAEDVLLAAEPDVFEDIGLQGVAAAVWQRRPEPSFQAWLDNLPARHLPTMRVVTPLEHVQSLATSACEQAKMPDCEERNMLIDDIAALAFMAGNVLACSSLRVRLDVASNTMCPKFHLDAVPARLLCTYRGAGTEYCLEGQTSDSRGIRTVRTGSAALFRGANWPSKERTALLHRSPAVRGSDATRLLLVIDPVDD
ncbi:DUF1826 domain-containing protein [Roseibium sp. SCPC15]|uniref:DUF1826 domain-containing protein n=1 Tax=Roseibium sp. SCP15 TaxID=3141376 RepID=UPI003336F07D